MMEQEKEDAGARLLKKWGRPLTARQGYMRGIADAVPYLDPAYHGMPETPVLERLEQIRQEAEENPSVYSQARLKGFCEKLGLKMPTTEKGDTMKTYISLAISDTMFPDQCSMKKRSMSPEEVQAELSCKSAQVVSALNPSHSSTIDVIRRKFNIDLPIPDSAPKVSLHAGDALIVLQAQLPRLAEGETHSQETVENAVIKFSLWNVQ